MEDGRGFVRRIVVGEEVVSWIAKRTNEFGNFGCATGIGLQRAVAPHINPGFGYQWKLIAGVAYAEWNGVNFVCHIASEGQNWLNREFLSVIFDYPFVQVGAKWLTVCVGEGNQKSRRFVEHLGFTQEANLQGRHPTGDLIIYGMQKKDCRFLREPYANLHQNRQLLAA